MRANWISFHSSEDLFTCPNMCTKISGGKCVNIPAGGKDTVHNCTATHYRCDGDGNCTAPTYDFWGPCLNWDDPGDIPGDNCCDNWCKLQGYIGCVDPGLAYYLLDDYCGTFERYYGCFPPNCWSAADDGRSWKCRCKDYVYD